MVNTFSKAGKEVAFFYILLFLVWGLYRYLFRLPVFVEEIVLKGLVFGGGTWLFAKKAGWSWQSLGIGVEGLAKGVRWGMFIGFVVGLVGQLGNIVRHGGLLLLDYDLRGSELGTFLLLSLITAFWEQLVFSGYMLKRLQPLIPDDWLRAWVVALLFMFIHVPALMVVIGLSGGGLLLSCILLLLMQLAANLLRYRFVSLAAPALVQALWGVTIYLFR